MDFFPFIVEHFTKTEVFTIVSLIYIIIYYLSTVCIWNAAECLTPQVRGPRDHFLCLDCVLNLHCYQQQAVALANVFVLQPAYKLVTNA